MDEELTNSDLHTRYRPKTLEDVVGQKHIIRSLKGVVEKRTTHAFLFTGPSGVGKTTLGRIIANMVGCDPGNLTEVDAATNSGIDAVRSLTDGLQYSAFGKSRTKVMIVDECHALSKAAWQALLKPIEEPPKHVYWVLCTTEKAKVPATIVTRCVGYDLKPITVNDITELLTRVRDAEGLSTSDDVLDLIAKRAEGSARQALTSLAKCGRCKDREQAAKLIDLVQENKEIVDLCRELMKGPVSWSRAIELLEPLKDQNAESIRQVVLNYMTNVAFDTKDERRAATVLTIINAFAQGYMPSNNLHSVLLSLGKLIFEEA